MYFYRVDAKHNMAEEDVAAKTKEIYAAFKKFNHTRKDAYYFIAEMSAEAIIAAFVVFGEDTNEGLMRFPWEIAGFGVHAQSVTEITSYEFGGLLETAVQRDLLENFRFNRILRERLKLFSHDYREGILADDSFYGEDIAGSETNIAAFERSAREGLWEDALVDEFKRIARMPKHEKFMGHPVHYLFASDDYEKRERQAANLISALYANGRLRSRRYCTVSVSNVDGRGLHYLSDLYHCYNGGTVMLRFRRSARQECDWADISMEVIYKLTALIKEFSNKVLTILCFPLSCEKEKDIFYPELTNISFLEFRDDAVCFDKAKKYLKQKAKKGGVQADEKLFAGISQEKTYRATELDRVYDEWYSELLRSKLYPGYAHCARAGAQVLQREKKGSAHRELMGMVGLGEAKRVITKAVDYFKAQKTFADMGFEKDRPAMHMIFTGNPGTAKTTVARLFASIMRENEVLSSGHLVEVGRADIVGKYIGSTAPLVKTAFRKAKGGVLFIDEAYSLVDDRDGLYGDEAINTIVQEMENNRDTTCVIFAGYPDKMKKFLEKNPGLRSRIAFHVPFEDYSCDELLQITRYMGEKKGICFSADAMQKLADLYLVASEHKDFGNGRFVRTVLEKARMAQATRLISLGFDHVTGDIVKTITAADIEEPDLEKPPVRLGFGD